MATMRLILLIGTCSENQKKTDYASFFQCTTYNSQLTTFSNAPDLMTFIFGDNTVFSFGNIETDIRGRLTMFRNTQFNRKQNQTFRYFTYVWY